jgi:hypothetical protein
MKFTKYIVFSFVGVGGFSLGFWWDWGLNLGLHACKANVVHLSHISRPRLQNIKRYKQRFKKTQLHAACQKPLTKKKKNLKTKE